jgi:ATP synthase F1 delta subunit
MSAKQVASKEALAKSFIAYLKDENLYSLLPGITEELQAEVLRNQDVTVTSATNLSQEHQRDISKQLREKWGDHRVIFTVDDSLLTGMVIHFQDNIIDLSGKRNLRELKQTLAQSDE